MSYSGNMPDWHQYNPPQPGRTAAASHPQNVNSSHHFITSITPPALDGINLSADRQPKHQRNDLPYQRNYQPGIPTNCPTSTSHTTPGVHMSPLSNCVNHYGSTSVRNPIIDPPPMDPRLGINDNEMAHRNTQMPFNPSGNHTNTNLTVNPSLHTGGITSQTSPVAPLSPGRQSYSCKLPCCNPETNVPYQHWEKYSHYQSNPNYRDNVRPTNYQMENRRFVQDLNLRKDCIDNKEVPGGFSVEHRRNYDYKYSRKEMARNYQASGLVPNYQMQNYNFQSDCQKCPHAVKDYMRRGTGSSTMNPQNSGLMKYPEQQIPSKYNSKQLNYQNGSHQAAMPNTSTANLPSSLQNSYFNTPISRDVPREFSREYQESNAVNRMQLTASNPGMIHGGYQKYHVYQQKIAMQRYSLENHLRAMARVPGYQSHPKYQEYVMRYRELVRLQQNVDYQNFLQEPTKIPPTSPNAPAPPPPINLQFDQNGCLINSSYTHGHFSGIHNSVNPITNSDGTESSPQAQTNVMNPLEQNHYKHPDQSLNLSREPDPLHHIRNDVPAHYPISENQNENFDNMIVDVDSIDPTRTMTLAADTISTTTAPTADLVNSKEFADKPQLDVRQFLANWDETEEEEGNGGNTPEVSSNTSPVAVHNIADVNCNNVDVVSSPKEQNNQQKDIEQSPIVDTNIEEKRTDKVEAGSLETIEEFANSGTIVQCIQTDSSDIPTIHIVDHLPEDSELATIRTVYGDVTSLSIEQIGATPIEIINDNQDARETITLFGEDTGVCSKEPDCSNEEAATVPSAATAAVVEEVGPMMETSESTSKSPDNVTATTTVVSLSPSPPSPPSESTPQETHEVTQKNRINEPTSNLKKQYSFASEESHNPDDISLPDLPMSECTPISTTLNTPIHSDSEESSSHVGDLAISTNPIEIIQNSPIISFTHSPIKIDPYSNIENNRLSEKPPHDALDFDFTQNSKKSSEIEDFEIARSTTTATINDSNLGKSKSLDKCNNQVPLININEVEKSDKDDEFYPSSDPLVGMNQNNNIATKKNSNEIADSSNDITNVGDCSVGSLNGNAVPGTPVSRILSTDEIDTGKCPSIIDTEDFQQADDLDKLCNISLDSSCMMPLIHEDSQEQRLSSVTIDSMKNVLPITNLDELESSDDEQLDKDDEWVEVRSMDESEEPNVSVNDMLITLNENPSIELPLQAKETDNKCYDKQENGKVEDDKTPKYIRSIFDTSEDSQSTGFDEFMRKRKIKDDKQLMDRFNASKESRIENFNVPQSNKNEIEIGSFELSTDNHSSTNDLSNNKNAHDEIQQKIEIITDEGNTESIKNSCKNDYSKIDTCKSTQSFRRTHKDTDVEIHVANINVEKLCDSASKTIDAIEIKINVSRHDKKYRINSIEKSEERMESKKLFSKFEKGNYCPEKIFPRRRISNPEESRRSKKEIRRRHSGGNTYRSYRKSTEKINEEEIRNKNAGKYQFPVVKSFTKEETSELSLSEGPISSHDDSQESVTVTETPNTCDSQGTEGESVFEGSEIDKLENVKRRDSSDSKNFGPDFDELENMVLKSCQSKLPDTTELPGPSSASQTDDAWHKLNFLVDNTSAMDFDNFDVAPNDCDNVDVLHAEDITCSTLTEDRALSRRLEEAEKYRNPYSKTNDEALQIDLNTVPVYTTKDGRVKYSPNPRYTYRVLIMEARQREGILRDDHYEKFPRDYQSKRLQKRRHDSPSREERRKNWSDYSAVRSKQSSSNRKLDDSSWRSNRSTKYDRWRERPPELESDDPSIESTKSNKSEFNRVFPGSKRNERFVDDLMISSRKSSVNFDGERGEDSFMIGCINNLTVTSRSHDVLGSDPLNLNNTKSIEARIFDGDELELFSRKGISGIVDAEEMVARREISPLNNLGEKKIKDDRILSVLGAELSDEDSKDPKDRMGPMKPPVSVDLEQDSQAMLTDSGLESSTTYTEGSKEPKRCSIWQRGVITDADKISSVEKFEETSIAISGERNLVQSRDNKRESVEEKKDEKTKEDKDILEIRGEETISKEVEHVPGTGETPLKDKETCGKVMEPCQDNRSCRKPVVIEELKTSDISKLTKLFLLKNYSTHLESRTLKGLDLAFPTRQISKGEKARITLDPPKEESKGGEDSVSGSVETFDRQSSSFLCTKKTQVPSRRASSDEVTKAEEKEILFFANTIKFPESSKNLFSEGLKSLEVGERKTSEFDRIGIEKNEEKTEGKIASSVDGGLSLAIDHHFEKPEVPPVHLFKSFVAPARNHNNVDTPDISTESEVSQLDETLSSTQFGSEYAASKLNDGSSTGFNFLSASSQEAVDATDIKGVRKNLALCALDDKSEINENSLIKLSEKIDKHENFLTFSGRISSESEDDSNAQDGSPIGGRMEDEKQSSNSNKSGEEIILNFSGKIRSPEGPPEPHIPSPRQIDLPNDDKPVENSLNFIGKIPSPRSSEEFSIKCDNQLELNAKINVNEEKNLTFSGKIQSDGPCRSPTATFDKIPKFIIKKTDCSSRSSSISQIFPSDISAQRSVDSKASSSRRISLHPKIPKMIIRNVRSRPGTPTIEENAVELSFPKTHESDNEKVFEVKIKLDDKTTRKHGHGDIPIRKSIGLIECKVPKMKIKLEDKNSRMIFENASVGLSDNDSDFFKNIPKVKIRKIKRSASREKKPGESSIDKLEKYSKIDNFKESSLSIDSSFHDDVFSERYSEKIPTLKIKKQEQRVASLSPEPSKRKRPRSPTENSHKRVKKSSSRHRSSESRSDFKSQIDIEATTNSTTNLSEKIPKVIIKRASSTSEFKCELSKDGGESIVTDSKWQPEVKLERFEVLDSIAKEQGRVHLPLKLLGTVGRLNGDNGGLKNLRKLRRTSSDSSRREDKSDRSSSRGRRRYSDPEKLLNHCTDDADSKDLPVTISSDLTRRIDDNSTDEMSLKTRTEFSSVITRLGDDKTIKDTSRQTVFTEDITRSEFEYPNVISSHKKLAEICIEPVVPALTGENANDAIGDTKSSEGQSVIKLESSDESQTTIEILPASSDISQLESEVPIPLEGERRIANGDMARVYSSDAIPTQFELELEIVDNSSGGSLEVPVPGVNASINETKESWNYPQIECSSVNTPGTSFLHRNQKNEFENVNIEAKSICSSDSLVKDVLAAKETLKKYLATSKHVSSPSVRTKTPAEKKQFTIDKLLEFSRDENEVQRDRGSKSVFQKGVGTSSDVSRSTGFSSNDRERVEKEKSGSLREQKRKDKSSDDSISVSNRRIKDKVSSRDCSSTGLKRTSTETDNSSMKKIKSFSNCGSSRKESSKSASISSSRDTLSKMKSHKSITLPRPYEYRRDAKEEKKKTTEVMPTLEPEGCVNFQPNSRDTSRSPPVITKQDSELNPQSPKKVEVNVSEKIERMIEQESEAMTFADIVAKMAYHEKATIKHRRYCILCERWFPTTARHRRHLSGYQHRHTELTQRRTVHALFMLFTGKPCPRLLPASIVRTDCAPGEPTPLQIAVQDVAISLEKTAIDKTKKIKEENE